MHRILGIVVVGVIVIATIWAFNHFGPPGGISSLGVKVSS